jgi:hypothetical protein
MLPLFVLLVGEKGLGPWEVIEYYEALDRRVKQHDFPIVLVLLDGQPAPELPFLRQLHWIISADPASEKSIQVMDAAAGGGALPGELWRHTAPYRGLAAMTEADTDFFFGRGRETVEVIRALEATPEKLPVLLGNPGVGKSSLAQAGVLAGLAHLDRQQNLAPVAPGVVRAPAEPKLTSSWFVPCLLIEVIEATTIHSDCLRIAERRGCGVLSAGLGAVGPGPRPQPLAYGTGCVSSGCCVACVSNVPPGRQPW